MDKEMLEAIKAIIADNNKELSIMMDTKLNEKLEPVIEELHEVRGATNQLLTWAEDASVTVQVPLFKKAE